MELRKKVEELIKEVRTTHKYSMSGIYGLWNTVFDKNEIPQSCASCLIRKVEELDRWLKKQPVQEEAEQDQPINEAKEEVIEPKRRGRKGGSNAST